MSKFDAIALPLAIVLGGGIAFAAHAQSLGDTGESVTPLKLSVIGASDCEALVISTEALLPLCADDDGCKMRLMYFIDGQVPRQNQIQLAIAAIGDSYAYMDAGGLSTSGSIGDNVAVWLMIDNVGGCGLKEDDFFHNGDFLLEACHDNSACTLRVDD